MTGSKPRRGLADFLSRELKPQSADHASHAHEPAQTAVALVREEAPAAAPIAPVASATTSAIRDVSPLHEAAPLREVEPAPEPVREVDLVAPKPRADKTRKATARIDDAAAEPDEPLYLRLTRKEVRFRDEQLEGLHRAVRKLSRARRGAVTLTSERITENTLVRAAVDLLLQHVDDLAGHDEATLLESLRKACRKRG